MTRRTSSRMCFWMLIDQGRTLEFTKNPAGYLCYEQLTATPARHRPAIAGYRNPAAALFVQRKRLDVDFRTPGFIGNVRDPVTIPRKLSFHLIVLRAQIDGRLAGFAGKPRH